ncbi:hypothetical protein BDY19DRAFT_636048 [Irpex rosettiformis]|uniref:Uncharacterized protein n=1 Tax=Irpex rosettiformis TaxID=378272 RepID=A0ACB8UBA5_9APHY|nr:hypothetical protein BDY19DRAFT_636048 [Irpex rosettiformis]
MTDELITKRLHVSGLTPSITPTDLSQKLGSFGTITALDGFGGLDALGQPRKFGYVTIETTRPKLAKCMNLLSGVTWKGTTLRLGEAKPDFRERLAKEREAMEYEQPPLKKRRLPRGVQGIHASDMSPVTPENVSGRGGWKVTPLGRIIKPIRMRPEHPLPPLLESSKSAKVKIQKGKDGKKTKKRVRVKEPPVRARRRTIDPLKWGSTQLKGVFLENVAAIGLEERKYPQVLEEEADIESSEDMDGEMGDVAGGREVEGTGSTNTSDEEDDLPSIPKPIPISQTPNLLPSVPPTSSSTGRTPTNATGSDLLQEKNAALGLLQSLFGGRDDDDWAGRESIDSDVEMDEQVPASTTGPALEDDIEEVPMNIPTTTQAGKASQKQATPDAPNTPPGEPSETQTAAPKAKLKDLFAPQEENAGFSLLGHLDLDLELDDEALDSTLAVAPAQAVIVEAPATFATIMSSGQSQARVTLDPSLPLFFPLSDEARANNKGRVKDPLDVSREKGWEWRTFCRTQSSEEIKQRWESQKVELTKDWKRRHREAIKSRRRRGGGDGE